MSYIEDNMEKQLEGQITESPVADPIDENGQTAEPLHENKNHKNLNL